MAYDPPRRRRTPFAHPKIQAMAQRSDYAARHTAVMQDPSIQIKARLYAMAETDNPLNIWEAIQICIEHKKEFPDRVLAYLWECAERMQSEKAKQAHDLRSILPWILAFPRKLGPGGTLLKPPGDHMTFAIRFAIRIEQGEKPFEALRNACNDVLPDDTVDDKTLRSWIMKEFETKKFFRTNADWKTVTRKHYSELFRQIEELSREIAS
jgi:hypothetical protein